MGGNSAFLVMLETSLGQALGSSCPQTLPQRLGLCPVCSIRSQMPTPLVTVRSCTGAPAHLSPVPTGCPSPSSRVVCHGPVMGTATASQWSTTASRRPSTSRLVSSTSLFSRRPTLRLVGELWGLGCWAGAKMKSTVWMFPNLPPFRVPWPYFFLCTTKANDTCEPNSSPPCLLQGGDPVWRAILPGHTSCLSQPQLGHICVAGFIMPVQLGERVLA